MSITRKYAALTLLISGLLGTPVLAENRGSQFSLTLDALGQGVYDPASSSVTFGGGGLVFLDWRPLQPFSLGFGGQYAYYPYGAGYQLATIDVGARIFPAGTTGFGEFYLQLGGGWNYYVAGNYHGYAGLGYREFFGGDTALDMGIRYDCYSPFNSPLQAGSAHIGLTFLFGRDDWSEPIKAKRSRPRKLVIGAPWTGPATYAWKSGDDLRFVAFKIYGDEGLYPLIVDNNKNLLEKEGLKPGIVLSVPPPPKTEGEVNDIENRAFNDTEYMDWQKVSEKAETAHDPSVSTYVWKLKDDLPGVAQKLYGDQDMYSLLVDTNDKKVIRPENLVPGTMLKVPRLPSSKEGLSAARAKAQSNTYYLWWKNISREHFRNLPRTR